MDSAHALDLSSSRWAALRHAYGSAEDVPRLLAQLASGDPDAAGELTGALFHQGSVYSASLAAVPHLLEIARVASTPQRRADVLVLAGSIALNAEDVPRDVTDADIRFWCEITKPALLTLAQATLRDPIEPTDAVWLLQVAAGLSGYHVFARILVGFLDKEFVCHCPNCDTELYVWPHNRGLSVASEDPVFSPTSLRTPVIPGPIEGTDAAALRWLLDFGGQAALSIVAPHLEHLFGRAQCPSCCHAFVLLRALEAYPH